MEKRGQQKDCLYEVSASKIPSAKFCDGVLRFVTTPPFHETSTISLGFHECPGPSTKLVE